MNIRYSRAAPSQRYQQLQAMYKEMHERGEAFLGIPAAQTFPGMSLFPQATRIKRLIDRTSSRVILDYGSGKGLQYQPKVIRDESGGRQWNGIQDYWGVERVCCYDPCYEPHSELPAGRFDGVISTDVLEHCPEQDVPWIIDEIFSYADRFVFANVACYPAKKRLPNGENAHCTIKPVDWWRGLINEVAAGYPELRWEIWIQFVADAPGGQKLTEEKLGNVG